MQPSLPLFAICFLLAACGPGQEESDKGRATAPEAEPGGSAGDIPAEGSLVSSGDRYNSAYTSFTLEECTVLEEEREEGSSASYRCPGFKGIPVFVQEGDLRFDLDAGAENDLFETTGPYNTVMDTLEWRMKDGKPFAVIFRYSVHNEIGPQPTTLAIETIGTAPSSGCRVAHIAGSVPDANRRARKIADETAPSFACGRQKPQTIGDATLSSLGG